MRSALAALRLVVLLWTAGPALAQSAPERPSETPVAAAALRRIDVETHTAVHVVTRQDLVRMGHLGLGEILQRLPFMAGSAPDLNGNAAGDGSVLADIGGIGRARCVVLLNGRRLPVNDLLGAPAVDLETIPLDAIDRIEIFLGGASPLWGADAVSGVVNVITRGEAQGMELTTSASRSTHGDAESRRAGLFAGRVSGRGHVNVALAWRDQEPIESAARAFGERSEALGCLDGPDCVWPFGSSATRAGAFLVPAGNALGLAPGRYTVEAPGVFREFRAAGPQNDLYSVQSDAFLRAGRSGASLVANAGYDLSPATRLTLDLAVSDHRVRRRLAPLPLATATDGATPLLAPWGVALLPVRVAADSFYNPFGVELADVRRRLVELGPRSLENEHEMQLVAGTVQHEAGAWDVEATLAFSRSRITEKVSHVLREDRLASALGPSGPDASGVIRCGAPDPLTGIVIAPVADCVPLDLFGGPGSLSREMLDYVTGPGEDSSRVRQAQAGVIARRDVDFVAPARMALGIESRRMSARYDTTGTDPFVLARGTTFATSGTVDQHDLVAEIAWPLPAGEGPASTLTTGARVSWFESRSPIASAFAAAAWRPSAQLLVRGRVTQVYRAPSAGELFLGHRERIVPLANPCAEESAQTSVLCAAGGVDELPQSVTEAAYFTGGNPHLRPERGYGASTGIAWSPAEDAFRYAALDLTWVRLDDAIRQPGALELIDACRESADSAACARLLPASGGNAFAIDGRLVNGGRIESARLDLELRDGGSTRFGDWRAELLASRPLRHRLTDVDGDTIDLLGTYDVTTSPIGVAHPRLQARGRLQWVRAPWTLEWSTQYVGSYDEVHDRNGLLPPGSRRRVGSATYHDLAVSWSGWGSLHVQLNVDNAFDRPPPRVNNGLEANTDAPTYRLEGRLISLSVALSR